MVLGLYWLRLIVFSSLPLTHFLFTLFLLVFALSSLWIARSHKVPIAFLAGCTLALAAPFTLGLTPKPPALFSQANSGVPSPSDSHGQSLSECDAPPWLGLPEGCENLRHLAATERSQFGELERSTSSRLRVAVSTTDTEGLSSTKYAVTKYNFPDLLPYYLFGEKPTLYLAESPASILAVTGDGVVMFAPRRTMNWQTIPNNLEEILPPEIFSPGWFSVKGLLFNSGNVLITASSTNVTDQSKCWNTKLFGASYSETYLEFEALWEANDCVNPEVVEEFNAHQAGGALAVIDGEGVLVSHGEYRSRAKAQDVESDFGSITLLTPSGEQIMAAIGLRNPQGMAFDSEAGNLWIVDQGPLGGDEVNLMKIENFGEVNFGWPVSSYGEHYDGQTREDAPLLKSHAEYGFTEPLWQWTPSFGTSSVSLAPESWDVDLVVGTMGHADGLGARSITMFAFDSESEKASLVDLVALGERVRSIIRLDASRLLVSVDSGSMLIIERL